MTELLDDKMYSLQGALENQTSSGERIRVLD